MSDSDSLESESEQPLAKNAKSHYDTLKVNNKKNEREQRYREQSRKKLKQREVERRKRLQYVQSIAGPSSTTSNLKRTELNNEETIAAIPQSSSGLEGSQTSSIQRNEEAKEKDTIQKRRERQLRYREKNREKLKQRRAEKRKRLQYLLSIAGPSPSSNINRIELNDEETIAAISKNSSGLEGTQISSIQRNELAKGKIALQKHRKHQQIYREKNREKLRQRKAERRKRLQYLLSIAEPSPSSNINRIELNDEETIAAISKTSSGLEGTQISSIDRNELAKVKNAIQKSRERQKRYREKNREKLKQLKAESRKRIKYLRSIAEPSTSSNINRIKLNDEETIAAISQSSSGLGGTHTSSIQRNEQAKENNTLQKKRERQQRYREKNREKLRQRKAERRKRLQNSEMITESSTSSNIEFTEIINKPIIDEISTNSKQ
ncbi:unnamed protein product [Euphydryas editha]|uniref:Uncharacterized protein n=1 Tax=Euphydryas editha TaxID=104508 RepID=A0AAU9UI88_EUPED|nr:unnamed protein product [Euphydryas editha]